MKNSYLGVLYLLVHLCANYVEGDIQIAAFNVQIFGVTKMNKPEVVSVLVQIIHRYDVILIQEIRDVSETAILDLMDKVNEGNPQFLLVTSERLGRSSSKEQYAFLYREDSGLSLSETYQYPDASDLFQREPFAAKFHSTTTDVSDFVLVAIHTSPDDAVDEINGLDDVHRAVEEHWGTDNIIIMGDFNADCRYVSASAMLTLKLRVDSKYHWLIEDDVDTTTTNTDCAYDRFVATGERLLASIDPDSAKVFSFDQEYGLPSDLTLLVSDHYPIEMVVRSEVPLGALDESPSGSGRPTASWYLVHLAVSSLTAWNMRHNAL